MKEKDKIIVIIEYLLEKLREQLSSCAQSHKCTLEASEKAYGNFTEINTSQLQNLIKDQISVLLETQYKLIDIEDLIYKLNKIHEEESD